MLCGAVAGLFVPKVLRTALNNRTRPMLPPQRLQKSNAKLEKLERLYEKEAQYHEQWAVLKSESIAKVEGHIAGLDLSLDHHKELLPMLNRTLTHERVVMDLHKEIAHNLNYASALLRKNRRIYESQIAA